MAPQSEHARSAVWGFLVGLTKGSDANIYQRRTVDRRTTAIARQQIRESVD